MKPDGQKTPYREYLQSDTKFQEVYIISQNSKSHCHYFRFRCLNMFLLNLPLIFKFLKPVSTTICDLFLHVKVSFYKISLLIFLLWHFNLPQIEPVEDAELRFSIQLLYYVTYLKDVILAGFIDDQLSLTLESHTYLTSGSILNKLVSMPSYLQSILKVSSNQNEERTQKQVTSFSHRPTLTCRLHQVNSFTQ